ncbi:TPA: hypothetical protein DEW47_00995 [Patescibacteria group bacterium]|nr:MAG: Carboxy-terminal-processing protease [Parcubacteria group bacterium GW2011_GWF2_40_10]KKR47631.1 MAG: Carboxy-terminal-processing protease [Parcubacteria group bacterium GW2011_GWA2_40_143]KKR59996.1 MAG: Carboxy-terminal-processing protease [Parcubacteria group bacterium GW2011_GWC2_40_31]KKR75530.1 MAG: Carboxy-terminal-processing protease [Parcubacteria group bacterium GW2011_GWB2_40_8]KKR82717.1 MAG: Carboxy-terminal-processing protease [Parcubacteria group bacterium GW2011_GWD2_40_
MKNKKLKIIFSTLIILGIFAGGSLFGYTQGRSIDSAQNIVNKEEGKNSSIDFYPFWKTWNIIRDKYVANEDLDDQAMVWGAISGLVGSTGDPHSVFFPPEDAKEFEDNIRGDFGGVGMEIGMRNGILTVIAPLKNTPAYKAGIKAGDIIIEINGESTVGLNVNQAVKLIRGEIGTTVKLTILHKDDGEPQEIAIVRNIIQIPIIDTEQKENGIFVISLYSFTGSSMDMFREALREFVYSGSGKLILDLRGNPGGFLESAVDLSSWFLPMGKTIAKEKFGTGEETIFRSKGYNIFTGDLPFVILINEGSASASEIMAGALSEHGKAKTVGQKTFGKGSVQELVPVTVDTSLKITIAKWLTPNGISIEGNGLTPDVEVEIKKEDIESGRDPQMEKAIEMVNNWAKYKNQ